MENFRIIRVNELLKRAISDYLHQNFTAEAVSITITQVKATADLKAADVYFSVFSAEEKKITENTVLLVGLLYNMCKVELVLKAKTDNDINSINTKAIHESIDNANAVMADKFQSH